MARRTREPKCEACGTASVDIHYGDADLCHRCLDARELRILDMETVDDGPDPDLARGH